MCDCDRLPPDTNQTSHSQHTSQQRCRTGGVARARPNNRHRHPLVRSRYTDARSAHAPRSTPRRYENSGLTKAERRFSRLLNGARAAETARRSVCSVSRASLTLGAHTRSSKPDPDPRRLARRPSNGSIQRWAISRLPLPEPIVPSTASTSRAISPNSNTALIADTIWPRSSRASHGLRSGPPQCHTAS